MLLHGLSMVSQGSLYLPQSLARSALSLSPYVSGSLSVARDVIVLSARNLPLLGASLSRSQEAQFEELTSFTISNGHAARQFRKSKGKKVKGRQMCKLQKVLKAKSTPFSLDEPSLDDFSHEVPHAQPLHDGNSFKLSMGLQSSLL